MTLFNAIPMTFFSIWVYSNIKLDNAIRGVVTTQLIGALIRALSYPTDSFWPVAIGTYICSSCNPFYINVQGYIANVWFTDSERGLASAIQIVSSPLGAGIGYGMVGGWFQGVKKLENGEDDPMEFKEKFKVLMVTHFLMALVAWIIVMIFIKEKPDKPPSAIGKMKYEALDFRQSVTVLKENPNFLKLLIAYAFPFGSFLAVGSLLSNVFDPLGFTASEVSYSSLALLLCGVLGAVIFGAILDKTHKFKITVNVLTFMMAVLTTWLIVVLAYFYSVKWPLVVSLLFGGFFCTGYIPVCFTYANEITFPLQPALVNGMLSMVGYISSWLMSMLGAFLINDHESDELLPPDELNALRRWRTMQTVSMMTISSIIAFIMSFFIDEDLRRINFGKEEIPQDEEELKEESPKEESPDAINDE